jgi:diadenosine tetraphosphate (Ap4A) HIT family hydrolase
LWTLTTGKVPGYSFLTSKRHIPYLADLDGAEASALGPVLARLSAAIREATDAELVHIHVFGDGAAHFHLHLVPHTRGDSLNMTVVREDAADEASEATLAAVAARLSATLSHA